jgi:DNA-binding NarL/FixJ family response regulator
MIRVLIAEDQALLREALADILARYEDIDVVSQVGRGDEVVAAALQARPDVALLDIEMPGKDGLTAAGEPHDRLPSCRVLILTVFGRPGYLRRALDQGAIGFVLKDASPSVLVDAIRRTALGQRVIDPQALFVGAPAYKERTWLHDPTPETLRASIRGVEKGVARLTPAKRSRVGLAVYAEWTLTGSDWAEFRQHWLS